MAKQKFIIPEFVEIFGEVRGDPTKHLNQKGEDGEYLVPDSVIAEFAKVIRASEFYCEPWLVGCEPATVLFERVIKDLKVTLEALKDTKLSEEEIKAAHKKLRLAVNAAYGAETRIRAMGLDAYIEWRRAGMPATPKVKVEKPSEKPKPPAKKAAAKQSSRPSVPLPVLKAGTANKLNGLLAKQHLLDQMPEAVREMAEDAKKAMAKGQLLQPTAEAVLVAVEQWLLLRKVHRDEAANQAALARLITPALQQYDYLLSTFAGDERVVEHLTHLREALESANAKVIASAIKAGDRLSGLLDGTIAPVVSINKPKEQTPTNIASAEYIRSRLGHMEAPTRGRAVPHAGKTQAQLTRRKGGGKRKSG